jgi:hypothetical protein
MLKVASVTFSEESKGPYSNALSECSLKELSFIAQAVSDELRDRRNRPAPPPVVEGADEQKGEG